MVTRKQFLFTGAAATAAGVGGALMPTLTAQAANAPIDAGQFPPLDAQGDMPWLGLATSLHAEHDYAPEVEGAIPAELRGTLYRNGPGLFERAGRRKRCLLDGDGMIQAYDLADAGVRYRNRFTRTEKYVEEQAAGKYLYGTWTTQAPGGRFANLFGRSLANQAGVSACVKNGTLYAFDESSPPHALDPQTLETRGLGLTDPTEYYSAHSKTDAKTGEWLHFGLGYGRNITVHLTTFNADGRLKSHRTVPLPRYCYMHDWFVTERYVVLNVHPAEFAIGRFLLGSTSLAGAMQWKPEQGNLLLVIPREGDPTRVATIETGAAWMWHSLNAYERGDEIVADFVGYDDPYHFLGDDPGVFAIMQGRRGGPAAPGTLRRYVVNLKAKSVRSEEIADGQHEFPIVNPRLACHAHRYGYCVKGVPARVGEESALMRFDTHTGDTVTYDFGPNVYCGEPVFAPKPGYAYTPGGADEPGWLLSQCYDGNTQKGFLAILRADALADGPVARIRLRHHVPISFHGWWEGVV